MTKLSELKKELVLKFDLKKEGKGFYCFNDKRKDGSRKIKMFFGHSGVSNLEVNQFKNKIENIRTYLINKGIEVKEGYGENGIISDFGLIFYLKN